MGGYVMGTFLGTILIYSGGNLITVEVITVWDPKIFLDLGKGGVPVILVNFEHTQNVMPTVVKLSKRGHAVCPTRNTKKIFVIMNFFNPTYE